MIIFFFPQPRIFRRNPSHFGELDHKFLAVYIQAAFLTQHVTEVLP